MLNHEMALVGKPRIDGDYAWIFWTYQWEPYVLGDHRILARAIDGTGQLQSSTEQKPFPGGAAGIQEVIVTVN